MRTTRLTCLFISLFVLFSQFSVGASQNPEELNVRVGDMTLKYTIKDGITLNAFGIPVMHGSAIWAMVPGWKGRYYGAPDQPNLLKEAKIENYKKGKKITLFHHHVDPNCPFTGIETIILLPNNYYENKIQFTVSADTPMMVEWTAGGVNPYLIIGQDYKLMKPSFDSTGTIWVEPKGVNSDEGMLAREFNAIAIQSKLGPMVIKSTPETQVAFFDYRKNRWADLNNPFFWLGSLESTVSKGKHTYMVSFQFPKNMTMQSSAVSFSNVTATLINTDNARQPNWDKSYIIPTPQSLQYTGELFPLNHKTKLYIGNNPSAKIKQAVQYLQDDLLKYYELHLDIVEESPGPQSNNSNAIILGELPRYNYPDQVCQSRKLSLPASAEGYCLLVEKNQVYLSAKSEKGIFYGLLSLLQLVKVDTTGTYLKGAQIQDYPALEFRGVHCFPAQKGSNEVTKAVRDLIAKYKMNSMIWETEYINWDSHPEIAHRQYGITKEDARKVIAETDRDFIEIIPLIQSLGHSEWIFQNGKNLDIAEDPNKPYAYCPTNPRTYDFIFSVYQEALDLFHPRYFHIGHDEVNTNQGSRFPYRSLSSGKTENELILGDILKLHEWFTSKDVKVMMWGDMFLHDSEAPDAAFAKTPQEAKELRAQLPKDITITDWHYVADAKSDYPSLKTWKDAGFDAIGSGWYRPENIRTHAYAAAKYGSKGYLQTTWAGFNFLVTNHRENWGQYMAYIWGAEYSWSGKNTDVDKLPYEAKQEFIDTWFERKPVLKVKPGFQMNLSKLYNRRLNDDAKASGWIGYGPSYDLSSFPLQQTAFGETQFKIIPGQENMAALFLYGKFNPKGKYPRNVKLTITPSSLSELHVLLNTGFRGVDKNQVGVITLHYADGLKTDLPLIYGENIFAYNDIRSGETARIAWRGLSKKNQSIAVWDLTLKNPNPLKPVTAITISSNGLEASPVIFAVTGVK